MSVIDELIQDMICDFGPKYWWQSVTNGQVQCHPSYLLLVHQAEWLWCISYLEWPLSMSVKMELGLLGLNIDGRLNCWLKNNLKAFFNEHFNLVNNVQLQFSTISYLLSKSHWNLIFNQHCQHGSTLIFPMLIHIWRYSIQQVMCSSP